MKLITILLFFLFTFNTYSSTLMEHNTRCVTDSIESNTIFIVSHGWHTGIVLPRKNLTKFIPQLSTRFPKGEYLEIGWGDKGFYQAKEITSGITIKAIFWPTDSVVHAVSVPKSPFSSFPKAQIRQLCLNDASLQSLNQFISASFKRDEEKHVISAKKGIYGDSQFYTGVGSYHLFKTCNKWTAQGLEQANFDINTTFKLTASSVLNFIDKHAETANKEQP